MQRTEVVRPIKLAKIAGSIVAQMPSHEYRVKMARHELRVQCVCFTNERFHCKYVHSPRKVLWYIICPSSSTP